MPLSTRNQFYDQFGKPYGDIHVNPSRIPNTDYRKRGVGSKPLPIHITDRLFAGTPQPKNQLIDNVELIKRDLSGVLDTAKNIHLDEEVTLPWEHDTDCRLYSTNSDKEQYFMNLIQSRIGIHRSENGRLKWVDEMGADETLNIDKSSGIPYEDRQLLKQAYMQKFVELDLKHSLVQAEKDFRFSLYKWIIGEGPDSEYTKCWWAEIKENSTAFFKENQRKKMLMHMGTPSLSRGSIAKLDGLAVKVKFFLDNLYRKMPRTEEECYLWYKYIVMKDSNVNLDHVFEDQHNYKYWKTMSKDPRFRNWFEGNIAIAKDNDYYTDHETKGIHQTRMREHFANDPVKKEETLQDIYGNDPETLNLYRRMNRLADRNPDFVDRKLDPNNNNGYVTTDSNYVDLFVDGNPAPADIPMIAPSAPTEITNEIVNPDGSTTIQPPVSQQPIIQQTIQDHDPVAEKVVELVISKHPVPDLVNERSRSRMKAHAKELLANPALSDGMAVEDEVEMKEMEHSMKKTKRFLKQDPILGPSRYHMFKQRHDELKGKKNKIASNTEGNQAIIDREMKSMGAVDPNLMNKVPQSKTDITDEQGQELHKQYMTAAKKCIQKVAELRKDLNENGIGWHVGSGTKHSKRVVATFGTLIKDNIDAYQAALKSGNKQRAYRTLKKNIVMMKTFSNNLELTLDMVAGKYADQLATAHERMMKETEEEQAGTMENALEHIKQGLGGLVTMYGASIGMALGLAKTASESQIVSAIIDKIPAHQMVQTAMLRVGLPQCSDVEVVSWWLGWVSGYNWLLRPGCVEEVFGAPGGLAESALAATTISLGYDMALLGLEALATTGTIAYAGFKIKNMIKGAMYGNSLLRPGETYSSLGWDNTE